MSEIRPGPRWPGKKEEPCEIGPCAAAPQPDEIKLETAFFDDTEQDGAWQPVSDESVTALPKVHGSDLEAADVEGLVAGIPVVGGVGEFTLSGRGGVQVRMEVVVSQNWAQVEWLKSRLFGVLEDEGGEIA